MKKKNKISNLEIKQEEVLEEEEIRLYTMDRKQGGTRICIIQQKTSILLSLEIDFQPGAMSSLEVDRITFQVLKVREGEIHW